MKKILAGCLILVIIGTITGWNVFLFLKTNSLKVQLEQNEQICNRLSSDINNLRKENEEIQSQDEQLKFEIVSYLGITNQLRAENKELKTELAPARKTLEKKERLLKKLKQDVAVASNMAQVKEDQVEKSEAEILRLKDKITLIEHDMHREKVEFYYNLGVAYTKAKMYDEAIKAYELSLALDPENAEANYNLGLIYQNIKTHTQTAIIYYQRYLELSPGNEDAQEIKALIMKLSGRF